MIARVSLARRAAAVAISLAIAQLAGGASVNAVDPPAPGPLDRPLVDLALVDAGSGAPPMLLTLDTEELPVGTVRASLLQRTTAWDPIGSESAVLSGATDGAEPPWLIELGPGRFAIVSTSHERGRTTLLPVRVAIPGIGPNLDLGEPTVLDLAVDDAGAVDVDGDGVSELVVAEAPSRRPGDVCRGSVIHVLNGSDFAQRAEWIVPEVRLAGGALGEWDGRPGGDLLAFAYGTCPGAPALRPPGIVAMRLDDGSQIVALSPEDRAGSTVAPGVPLVADLDADGRDEVVVRDGSTLVVLEPASDWARTEIARGDVMPLIAAGPAIPDDPGTIVWVDDETDSSHTTIWIGRIERALDGSFAISAEGLDLAAIAPSRRARMLRSLRDTAAAQAGPQAWRGEIDGDGCPEILAPLLTAECDGRAAVDALQVGASWFATRPVAVFDAGDNRELLVAATLEWDPPDGDPLPATPAAAGVAGAWRHGPSVRFALSEVRASDAIYFDTYPVPRPTIERAAVREAATDFPGFTGGRVFVRATAARPDDAPPGEAPELDAFLSQPVAVGELVAVARIPVPAGAESGRDGSFVHVSLADVVGADGGPAERWTVTIAQLNDWGEIAGPVRGTIVRDVSGPSVTLETPFLSAPWPLEATVHGRSEPGVEIRRGSGGPVTTDRRGRFELRTQLAPWPQTVELTAIDESGNSTTRRFSLVGGVDYRELPWPAILAVVLLLGAALSAARGTRTVRRAGVNPDDEPQIEIEDLPSIRGSPRS